MAACIFFGRSQTWGVADQVTHGAAADTRQTPQTTTKNNLRIPDERRALYDVLQASWSDTVYFLERERLEAWEAVEVGEADAPVVDYDDRHDGLE